MDVQSLRGRQVTGTAERFPLFADVPGFLASEDEYQQGMVVRHQELVARIRTLSLAQWRTVRAWLRDATPEQRAEFWRRWAWLPHKAEYAADLVRTLEKGAGSE